MSKECEKIISVINKNTKKKKFELFNKREYTLHLNLVVSPWNLSNVTHLDRCVITSRIRKGDLYTCGWCFKLRRNLISSALKCPNFPP
jgi:hypothetical protein